MAAVLVLGFPQGTSNLVSQSFMSYPKVAKEIMTYLDERALACLKGAHRQFGILAKDLNVINSNFCVSRQLTQGKDFKQVYFDSRVKQRRGGGAATFRCSLQYEGKNYLVILPHSEEVRIANNSGAKTPVNVLELIDLGSGEKRQFCLNQVLQGCSVIQEPMPILIFLNNRGEVLKMPFAQVLASEGILAFEEDSFVWDTSKDVDPNNFIVDSRPIFIATEGCLLAVSRGLVVNIFDFESGNMQPVSFTFKRVEPSWKGVSFFNGRLIAFSGREIEVIERNQEGTWENLSIHRDKMQITGRPASFDFQSVVLDGSNIIIGIDTFEGKGVGLLYNMQSKLAYLLPLGKCDDRDDFGDLRRVVKCGEKIMRIAGQLRIWGKSGESYVPERLLGAWKKCNTFEQIESGVIAADSYNIMTLSHKTLIERYWQQQGKMFDENDEIVCVELNQHFLTVVSHCKKEGKCEEKISVYNLLETSQNPLEDCAALRSIQDPLPDLAAARAEARKRKEYDDDLASLYESIKP